MSSRSPDHYLCLFMLQSLRAAKKVKFGCKEICIAEIATETVKIYLLVTTFVLLSLTWWLPCRLAASGYSGIHAHIFLVFSLTYVTNISLFIFMILTNVNSVNIASYTKLKLKLRIFQFSRLSHNP